MVIVMAANYFSPEFDILITIATLVGVTALIFAAKGNVIAQVLMIVFSLLYGIISYRFHYWGEMITYLGMTLPMTIWATVTWFKNPSENEGEVSIGRMTKKKWGLLTATTVVVTVAFYFILNYFDTPNILFSTISITTSFMAAGLMMLRSSYYAIWYAMNDVVLIVLWILATVEDASYFPVIINFAIFFINDLYGFVSWKKREQTN